MTARRRLAALGHADFRRLWFGMLVSTIGSQMQVAAVAWHVHIILRDRLTTVVWLGREIVLDVDALGLGLLGLARIGPVVVFALAGGLAADARDRRSVMLVAQFGAALTAAALAVLTLTDHITLPALYLLTALGAAASAFDNPARQALAPLLVPRRDLTNAISLNTLQFQVGTIVGPALAGVLLARFGLGVVYALDALSFIAVIVALLTMRFRGSAADSGARGVTALKEGLVFTFRSPIIRGTMLLDFMATLFATSRNLLPIVAESVLGVGPIGYGVLATAQSVGAVLAGTAMALRDEVRRQGFVLFASVALYGVATVLFGLARDFAWAYLFFALTGAGDTVSTVIRGTIRQVMTPDRLRGRMTSVNMVFFMGGPHLGGVQSGLIASVFGAPLAIVAGGLATVALTGVMAWRYPHLRDYTVADGVPGVDLEEPGLG